MRSLKCFNVSTFILTTNKMKLRTPDDEWIYFYKRFKVLRGIGCWPLYGKIDTKFEVIYTLLSAALIFQVLISIVLIFMATLNLMRDRGEFDAEVCEQVILFIISFQILAKMAVMAYKARHLQKLIKDLSGTMQRKFVIKTQDLEVMNHCRRYDHKLSKFFLTLSLLLFISSMFRPLAHTLRKVHKARSLNNGTIVIGDLPSKYPFELPANSFWYAFCYSQQVISVFFGALSSWVADSMFCGFLVYLCGHLDILSNNIRKKGEDSDYVDEKEHYSANENNKNYAPEKTLVDQHNYLIRFSKQLNKAFAPLIMVQLLLGAITIGLQLIQFFLIKSGEIFIYAKPMVYLSLKLVQLYISSHHGQRLWDRSVLVGEACYSSIWINQSRSWCKSLQMIMIRSRKPLKVEVGPLFQFSTEKFGNCLALFIGALCHDLDHRGKNNKFMIESASPLANMYTTSTMEHHHFNQTVVILQQDGHNILQKLDREEYRQVLGIIKHCILATDLALFFANKAKLSAIVSAGEFSLKNPSHRSLVQAVAMTASDLSASAKPWEIQIQTVKVIFQEFYEQGDEERAAGRQPIPMMDRNQPDQQAPSQVEFLAQICIPCYALLAQVVPGSEPLLHQCQKNLEHWKELCESGGNAQEILAIDKTGPDK